MVKINKHYVCGLHSRMLKKDTLSVFNELFKSIYHRDFNQKDIDFLFTIFSKELTKHSSYIERSEMMLNVIKECLKYKNKYSKSFYFFLKYLYEATYNLQEEIVLTEDDETPKRKEKQVLKKKKVTRNKKYDFKEYF